MIWVRPSRRNNRRFVHVRLEVSDVRRLNEAPPFAWSTYEFKRDGELYVYKQNVGASAGGSPGTVNWNGSELVAVRLHLPSKVVYQNTPDKRRGNIFVWEQPLTERLKGTPIEIEVRMETQSILYRTLWLFGATFLAVAVAFVAGHWLGAEAGWSAAPAGAGDRDSVRALKHPRVAQSQDVVACGEPRIDQRARNDAEANQCDHERHERPGLASGQPKPQAGMGQRIRATAKERKVHSQHSQASQRRCNDDGESHDRKGVDGAIHQQLLADEPERAGEAGARQAHGQEADRQYRHALVPP